MDIWVVFRLLHLQIMPQWIALCVCHFVFWAQIFRSGISGLKCRWYAIFLDHACFSSGCHRLNTTDWAEIYFSQFWRMEVQDQGASMVRFWWELFQGCNLTTSHILTWKRVERGSKLSHDFYKDTNPINEGSIFMTSSNHDYLPKISPNTNTAAVGGRGVGFQYLNVEETQTSRP